MNNKIPVTVYMEPEMVKKIDEEILRIKYSKNSNRDLHNRTGYIKYALSEYLKLPTATRYLIAQTR